jgi:hypothetical protein
VSENWASRAARALFDYGPLLPLTLCSGHPNRAVRVIGLFWHFVWCIPAMAAVCVPFLALLVADLLINTWRGYDA